MTQHDNRLPSPNPPLPEAEPGPSTEAVAVAQEPAELRKAGG